MGQRKLFVSSLTLSVIFVAAMLFAASVHAGSVEVENDKIGLNFNPFALDIDDDGVWNPAGSPDTQLDIAPTIEPEGIPVVGDWNGDGVESVGRVVGSQWFLDSTEDLIWNPGAGDLQATFAAFAGDGIPVVGDWNMDGADEIGKYLPEPNDFFMLDLDGNGVYESANDALGLVAGGVDDAATPVVGDWDGDGDDDIGKVTPNNSRFYLDLNGNLTWEGPAGGDIIGVFAAFATDFDVVVGDWDGVQGDEIGKYINVDPGDFFLLDLNGNYQWNNTGGGDAIAVVANGAVAGTPLVGDWDGDGDDNVAKADPASNTYYIDKNGNGTWEGPAGGDLIAIFFPAANPFTPIAGNWPAPPAN